MRLCFGQPVYPGVPAAHRGPCGPGVAMSGHPQSTPRRILQEKGGSGFILVSPTCSGGPGTLLSYLAFSPHTLPLATCKVNDSQVLSLGRTTPEQQAHCLPTGVLPDGPQTLRADICRRTPGTSYSAPPPVFSGSPTHLEGLEVNILHLPISHSFLYSHFSPVTTF